MRFPKLCTNAAERAPSRFWRPPCAEIPANYRATRFAKPPSAARNLRRHLRYARRQLSPVVRSLACEPAHIRAKNFAVRDTRDTATRAHKRMLRDAPRVSWPSSSAFHGASTGSITFPSMPRPGMGGIVRSTRFAGRIDPRN